MLHFVTPSTIWNRAPLQLRRAPKQLLGRGSTPWPRTGLGSSLFWRLVFENPAPRFVVALSPFPVALVLRPDWAFALAQAPLVMLGVVLFIETYVLSIADPAKRRALVDEVTAAKGLDRLVLRGKAALTEISAARGLTDGETHLVIEQSGLARAPVLTLISVQRSTDDSGFLDLGPEERAQIAATLFDDAFSERDLQRINLAQNTYLRSVALEARSVSAHARLAAMAKGR
ncbi:MAG: hypothetical protein AAF909_02435 [Pseudomonadota bacterium]